MPWQKGKYSRRLIYRTIIPYPFLLACKLLQVTPESMLDDFMNNLAHGSRVREGGEIPKSLLVNYVLAMSYGQQQYIEDDIRAMFKELDAIGMLFPADDAKLLEFYVSWRNKYYHYWFHKWYYQNKRHDAPITI